MNNYNDQQNQHQQQFMMNQQYGQFDQNQMQQQGGMHPNNMQMQHHQQRMQMEHQRPNFPQQIQRVPSQGTFQMNVQPQFQQNPPNANPYLIRATSGGQMQQPMQNMPIKHNQPQAPTGQMQQRMSGHPGQMQQQQSRMLHSNYANSPQFNNQQSGGSNVPMQSMQGTQMDANSVIAQMPPNFRQQFDAEPDRARKAQMIQGFARRLQQQMQPQQFGQFDNQPGPMSQGQMSQNQMSQNQMSQGPMSQGQMSQGPMSQGQMSQNQMSQNQMPQNQMSQNSMASQPSNTGIGMHPNMPMGQQRMPQAEQRSNFPQQMQNVSNQNNFQMSSNQPSQFQQAPSSNQPYLIRAPSAGQIQSQQIQPSPSQPIQNIKHSPMPQQPTPSGPSSIPSRTGGPQSASSNIPQPRSIHSGYANSPLINAPQSAQNVPNAVSTPRPAQTPIPVIDTNDPEYKKLLAEMKTYQKDTKILLERVRMDGQEVLEKSLLRVLEVMEGKRDVDLKLMNKLLANLKTSIRQHNPLKSMYEFINRVNVVPQNLDAPILPEAWDRLEQFKIKVPPHVLKQVEKAKEEERTRKRKLIEEKSPDTKDNMEPCDIQCVDQSAQLKLPKEITDELLNYEFSIDHNALPISEHVLYTQVIIQFKPKDVQSFKYSIPPLRLNIPLVKSKPIQLVPFHEDDCSPMQIKIIDALKKSIIDDSTMFSISSLVNLWRKVVTQQVIPASDLETRKLISVA